MSVKPTREFLSQGRLLVDAVAESLAPRMRTTPAGAKSLAHVLVVMPTRESARRLRQELARRLGAVVAPVVKMSADLLGADREHSAADDMLRLGVMAELLRSVNPGDYPALLNRFDTAEMRLADALDLASSLMRVWQILSEGAYLMRDVAERAQELLKGDNLDFEVARWQELSRLEALYLDALHKRSLTLPAEDAAAAIASPPELCGVEEIVLPGLVAPPPALIRVIEAAGLPVTAMIHASEDEAESFDDYGRLIDERFLNDLVIDDGAIAVYPTPGCEAAAAASFYAAVDPGDAPPAVVLAESDLFPEFESAFALRSLSLHSPSRTLVAASSLGRLASQTLALMDEKPTFSLFSAFVRQGDVQRHIASTLGFDDAALAGLLIELDDIKAKHLPWSLEEALRFASEDLRRVAAFVVPSAAPSGNAIEALRSSLAAVFSSRSLDESRAEDREFAAAASALRSLFDAFASLDLPDAAVRALFAKALESASYSLVPDDDDAVATDGWLELPYLAESEVLIVGVEEGAVPESVVGHAFMPDSLREALGLTTNTVRARRDAFMLREAISSRRPGMVRFSFHAIAADGSALKPSRLMLRTQDDKLLGRRARRLYSDPAAPVREHRRTFPSAWRLRLPVPGSPEDSAAAAKERTRLTPSAIDSYLRCPFTYFLKSRLGEGVSGAGDELDAAQFGSLCHDALDAWAKDGGGESSDESEIASALALKLDAIVAERFGVDPPALIQLQVDSARDRLRFFAHRQAERRKAGWKIAKTELDLRVVYDGVEIRGRADRIDRNEETDEWCVIDYKTWDAMDRASPFDMSARSVAFARERSLPVVSVLASNNKAKNAVWRSLQLPLYCAMLRAQGVEATISACYCVLGATEDDTGFSEPIRACDWASDSDKLVRELIRRIAAGIFWPPSPADEWRWQYQGVIFDTPADSVSEEWLASQTRTE